MQEDNKLPAANKVLFSYVLFVQSLIGQNAGVALKELGIKTTLRNNGGSPTGSSHIML